jgi:hypothetical protein
MAAELSCAVGPAAARAFSMASISTAARSISLEHGPAWVAETVMADASKIATSNR